MQKYERGDAQKKAKLSEKKVANLPLPTRERGLKQEKTAKKRKGRPSGGGELFGLLHKLFTKGTKKWEMVKALSQHPVLGKGVSEAKQKQRISRYIWVLEDKGIKVHYDPEREFYKI